MSMNPPMARSHGTTQDTEIDVAWQDLMTFTELQVTVYDSHSENAVNIEFFLYDIVLNILQDKIHNNIKRASNCIMPPYLMLYHQDSRCKLLFFPQMHENDRVPQHIL